jgi:CRP/FNR family transcriptional regulator, cyclic AMP receptor protein
MIVKEIDLFKGIDPAVMEEIVTICSEESYAKDTVLFKKDEEADCIYILEEGSVKLVIENGGSITYSLTDPGEVFGWSSMVEPGLYTASGICATDLKTVKIEQEKLDKIFYLHPDVGYTVLKRLAGVISERLSNAYHDLLSARGQDTTPSYG